MALHPQVKAVVKAAFPDYRGRKVRINRTTTVNTWSMWEDGSRDFFVAVRLQDCAVLELPTVSMRGETMDSRTVEIPEGAVVVEHSIFCGKCVGITVHARPEVALEGSAK